MKQPRVSRTVRGGRRTERRFRDTRERERGGGGKRGGKERPGKAERMNKE